MSRPCMVLLLAVFLSAGCFNRSGDGPIYVGHIAPLGTPAGEHAKQGILLAVEEVNEGEKVVGQKVAVLHVDSRGDATVAQAEAVRLAGVNKVAGLLIDADTGGVERVAKDLEPSGIPVLTTAVLSAPPTGENLFTVNQTAPRAGRALARYAATQLKPGRIAVLADQRNATAMTLAAAFVKEMPKNGPDVDRWNFDKPAEFPDLVAHVKKAKANAVLFGGAAADLKELRTQLKAAEMAVPVLFGGDDFAFLPAEMREDLYVATSFVADADEAKEFANKYRERFKEAPDVHAALAYESARVLFKAMNQAKTPTTGAAVRKELVDSESFAGVTGAISFAKDRVAKRPVYILHWKDGQAKTDLDKDEK
jgi:branched-chain amino acid transport system substrate-binding protein